MTAPVANRHARQIAFDHHATRESLADASAGVAVKMWAEIDPDRIVDSWAQQLPELTAIVSGTQVAAARSADDYVDDSLEAQDIEGPVEGTINPAAFAGASDGGALLTLLTNPVVVTLLTIADGLDVTRALARGRANLDGIVRTQVADAGRYADQTSLVAHRGAEGYVRVTDGNPCARCLILAGKFYRWNRGFLRHPRCGCMHIPTLVASPRFLASAARDFYDAMTPTQRTAAGFTRGMQHALDEGADIFQVVNASTRRGAVYEAGGRQFTREGATRRGLFGRMARAQDRAPIRLTPNQIFREAVDRDDAIRLLRAHGYLLDAPVRPTFAVRALPPMRIRPALAGARTADEVSVVLTDELARVTGRTVDVRLSGSVATAREHAEGLLRTVERYPDTPLTRVQTGPLPFARYAESHRGVVTFSEHWSSIEGRPRYLAALRADERRGWHPYSSPDGVASHEVVHVLDPDVPIESIVGRRPVTGYAARSEHEAVAEAVADVVVNGEQASVLSREITAAVDDAYSAGRIVGRRPRLARPGPPSRLSPPARSGPPARAAEAELQRLNVAELKALAKARGVTAPARITKPELVRLVDDLQSGVPAEVARARALRSILERQGTAPVKAAKAAATPDLTGARGLSTVPEVRAVQIENQIRELVRRHPDPTAAGVYNMNLADLRAALPDIPRSELDEALWRLGREPDGALITNEARHLMTDAETAAAVRQQTAHGVTLYDRVELRARSLTSRPLPAVPAKAVAKKAAPKATKAPAAKAAVKKAAPRKLTPGQVSVQKARELADTQQALAAQLAESSASPRAVASRMRSQLRVIRVEPVDDAGRALVGSDGVAARYVWRRPGGDVDLTAPAPRGLTAVERQEFELAAQMARVAVATERAAREGADLVAAARAAVAKPRKVAAKAPAAKQSVLGGPMDADEALLHDLTPAQIKAVAEELNIPAPVAHTTAAQGGTRRWPASKEARIRYLLQNLDQARARGGLRAHGRDSIAAAVDMVKGRPAALTRAASRQELAGAVFDRRISNASSGVDVEFAVPTHRGAAGQPLAIRNALDDYSSIHYRAVHGALRSDSADVAALTRSQVEGLDAAMAGSRLTSDAVVYRGLRTGRSVFGDNLDRDLAGFEWSERSFVSTSYRRNVAEQYATGSAGQPGVVMRVLAPRGTGAVYLDLGEQEVLLQRGLRLRVVRDRGVVDGRRVLDVEVVPAKAPASKPLPAPEKMTGPALRKELQAAGVEVPAKAAKPDMARWVGEVRGASAAQRDAVLARVRQQTQAAAVPVKKAAKKAAPSQFGKRAATGDGAFRAAPAGLDRAVTGLTEAQERAVWDYRGFLGYRRINQALRSGDASLAEIRALDEAMAASRLTDDVVVYRGLRYGPDVFGDRWAGDLAGAEFGDLAYVSTGKTLDQAEQISRHGFGRDSDPLDPVVMRILAPRGTGAIEASDTELLLERGLRFRVVADHGVVDGIRRIDVEVIGRRVKP